MFAVVDLETTGSFPDSDRIIEIAICVHDGNAVTREFSTLVNPGVPIPPFISRLTRITDEMVCQAPLFSDIAGEVAGILGSNVFVAHNVSFDYGFLKHALLREGIDYANHQLCTCRTSRKLLPGHLSYSLPRLCRTLGIEHRDAHRAASDARATATILGLLFDQAGGKLEPYFHVPEQRVNHTRIPNEAIDALPRKAGVLYFYDEQGEVIYLTRASNLRKKAFSMASRMKTRRFASMAAHAVSVDGTVTGNELMASVLEISELLTLKPRWNRRINGYERRRAIYEFLDEAGRLGFSTGPLRPGVDPVVIMPDEREAQAVLSEAKQLFGLQTGPDHDPVQADQAAAWLRTKQKNFIITLPGPETGSHTYVVVRNGAFAGWTGSGNAEPVMNPETVLENLRPATDHPAIFNQIVRGVGNGKFLKITEFA